MQFKHFTVNSINADLFLKSPIPVWNTYTRHFFRTTFLCWSHDAASFKCKEWDPLYSLGNINTYWSTCSPWGAQVRYCYLAFRRHCRWLRWYTLLPSVPAGKARLNNHKIQHRLVHRGATGAGCWWRETCLPSTNTTRWFSSVQPMESKFWARNKRKG